MNVVLTIAAARARDALPPVVKTRVLRVLRRLGDWPAVSGAKGLHGELRGHFRIRTGDYRVLFRIEGERIVVSKIGHREGFYE